MHVLTHHKHNHRHLLQYLLLFLLLVTAFTAFGRVSGVPQKQFLIGFITAITYVIWGIFHHLSDRDLHWKIVVEYFGLAFFGLSMLWILLSIK